MQFPQNFLQYLSAWMTFVYCSMKSWSYLHDKKRMRHYLILFASRENIRLYKANSVKNITQYFIENKLPWTASWFLLIGKYCVYVVKVLWTIREEMEITRIDNDWVFFKMEGYWSAWNQLPAAVWLAFKVENNIWHCLQRLKL